MRLPKFLERFDPEVSRRRRIIARLQQALLFLAIFLTGYIVASIRFILS